MAGKGIDASHWQGTNIDWKAVVAAGYTYAYLKASEGIATLDSAFVTNFRNAKAAGLLVGAYHYGHPNEDPVQNAVNFLNALKNTGVGDLDLVLDVEETDGVTSGIDTWAQKFIDRVQTSTGREFAIYSGQWFADTYLVSLESKYKLWIAKYGSTPPSGKNVVLWQSSQSGHVPGIAGNVDIDQGDAPVPVVPKAPTVDPGNVFSVSVAGHVFPAVVYNDVTHVVWTALNVFSTPHTYKGNGLMNVNGVDVQGVICGQDTYLPWTALTTGVKATRVEWEFNK